MNIRLISFAALLLATLVIAVRADEDDPEPSLSTKIYKSPQAVFEDYLARSEKKDYKGTLGCLTPQAQKDMGAYLACMALMMKNSGLDEFNKAYKPLFDVMDKYGLTEKATKEIKVPLTPDRQSMQTARTALNKLIKKPIPFAIDMMKAQEKISGAFGDLPKPKITLDEVKIDGDKANGLMVIDFMGNQVKQKIAFAKLGKGWKMIPSYDFDKAVPVPKVEKFEKR